MMLPWSITCQIVEMCVHMCCAGCEKKIRKAVERLEGVDAVEIDMEMQKVTVNGDVDQKKVLKTVRRTGKRAVLWPTPFIAGAGAGGAVNLLAQQHQYHPGGAQMYATHASGPTSSYNYYKHGYDDSRLYGANSAVVGGTRATDYFSDENPGGCSVM
ncbi:heavy metal-associated isoprenylated plant protein 28-like isoform X1 [Triticum dicoccoides]|uniref:heavy metal-associated isoprenylated plant protein 28-like isoform X1 n=1 Tax=Triticum dicoccoides TaxID=85692 RepID=UPI00189094DE|nr:heavy metal-associated isoprenylated plant protein 28-like isoform X1 [Triticum dicoccoides]